MFEKAEDEYNALVSKKNYLRGRQIQNQEVIEELDEKRKGMIYFSNTESVMFLSIFSIQFSSISFHKVTLESISE
ncbi:unnamed protein product [Arabidopsis lyrata]|nr:unnamed protein product [Arabidopsis lyrata]